MKKRLSLLMITKNCESLIKDSLESVKDLVDEIIIIDNYSTDKTVEIAKKYQAKVFLNKEEDLGKQKGFGLKKIKSDWVLVLDSDERVPVELKKEIRSIINSTIDSNCNDGYLIPFQNHFLGKPINFGGENYKMLRFFKSNKVIIKSALVHEGFFLISGSSGKLINKIYHYSYRTLTQMFSKFTDYAIREAKQKKLKGEKSSLKKIFLYPVHMFWARFIKDKGYKDGLFRILLDLGFSYMEFVTYIVLIFI